MNGVCVRVYVLMCVSKIDQKWLKRLGFKFAGIGDIDHQMT